VSFLNILVFLDTPGKLQVSSKVSPAVQDLVNVNFRNLYNYIGIQMEFGPWLGSGLSRQTSTASTDHVKFLQQGAARSVGIWQAVTGLIFQIILITVQYRNLPWL